jgi:Flp pilus assembly pilin Flp
VKTILKNLSIMQKREYKPFYYFGGFIMNTLKRFHKDEKGMETVEWAVLAALIVVGLVTVIGTLGDNVLTAFTTLSTSTAS